jgi:hypothetical protein
MYLHVVGDPKESFSTEEIQQNTDCFATMTHPLRPPDYLDYSFRELKHSVFPPKRILYDDEEEEEEPNEEAEEEKVEEPKPSGIATVLNARGMTVRPLVVDYAPGVSLNNQLRLDQPTIRAILKLRAR